MQAIARDASAIMPWALVASLRDGVGHAGLEVVGRHHLGEGPQWLGGGADLGEDVDAAGVLLEDAPSVLKRLAMVFQLLPSPL